MPSQLFCWSPQASVRTDTSGKSDRRATWAPTPMRLAAAQLQLQDLQAADRKRLPAYPVPAVRVGRLAVSNDAQGKGHRQLLLGHAVNCAMRLRETLGVRALLVDAKGDRAVRFYQAFGFRMTSDAAMTLYLPHGSS